MDVPLNVSLLIVFQCGCVFKWVSFNALQWTILLVFDVIVCFINIGPLRFLLWTIVTDWTVTKYIWKLWFWIQVSVSWGSQEECLVIRAIPLFGYHQWKDILSFRITLKYFIWIHGLCLTYVFTLGRTTQAESSEYNSHYVFFLLYAGCFPIVDSWCIRHLKFLYTIILIRVMYESLSPYLFINNITRREQSYIKLTLSSAYGEAI